MYVAIDDQHALGKTFGLHGSGSDSGVIEDTEPFATITKRMVRAAGQIGGHAIAQGSPTGADGRPGLAARSFDHAGTPRKTNGFLGLFWQLTVTNLTNVFAIVGAGQFFIAGRVRQVKISVIEITAGQQALTQPDVFFHRETMTSRQGQNENIGVKKLHGRCFRR